MARRLEKSYVHKGEVYIPGHTWEGKDHAKIYNPEGVEVELPDDFPSEAELEKVEKRAVRPGGLAPLNQSISKEPKKDEDETDYESMTKDELAELADKRGLEVERKDGDGEPLKADYVKALKKAK